MTSEKYRSPQPGESVGLWRIEGRGGRLGELSTNAPWHSREGWHSIHSTKINELWFIGRNVSESRHGFFEWKKEGNRFDCNENLNPNFFKGAGPRPVLFDDSGQRERACHDEGIAALSRNHHLQQEYVQRHPYCADWRQQQRSQRRQHQFDHRFGWIRCRRRMGRYGSQPWSHSCWSKCFGLTITQLMPPLIKSGWNSSQYRLSRR